MVRRRYTRLTSLFFDAGRGELTKCEFRWLNRGTAIAATGGATAAANSRDQERRGKRACGVATAARPRRADDVLFVPTQNKSQPIAGLQGGYDATFQYFSAKPAEDHGLRRRLGGLRPLCPPFLRRRQTHARRLGSLGSRR